MHIEGIAPGRTGRPTRSGEGLAADHRTEAVEQGLEQSGLDRGKRHPPGPTAQHTVVVEHRPLRAMTCAASEDGGTASVDIGLTGRQTNPVLEAVEELRGHLISIDHDQTRNPLRREERTAIGIAGQGDEGDIHGGKGTGALFPDCFVDVKA